MEDLETRLLRAREFYNEDEDIKALEILVDLSLVEGSTYDGKTHVNILQGSEGTILYRLAEKAKNPDVKFAYLLGSLECFSGVPALSPFAAHSLFYLAQHIGSVLYYKESLCKAKGILLSIDLLGRKLKDGEEKALECIVNTSESKIAESKTCALSPANQTVGVSKNEEMKKSDSESKRNFVKVNIVELRDFVERLYGREGGDPLEQVLSIAMDGNWRFWMCRSCCKNFFTAEECKNHIEQEHAVENKSLLTKAIPQRISQVWGCMISSAGWIPVDAGAAVEMIKNQLEYVKTFDYENGWATEWPAAVSFYEERSKLLQEIRLLLVSFFERKLLSCSILDWVMHFVVNHFESLKVPKQTLTDCHLMETPQSICFLEYRELSRILNFLKTLKCVRHDGTDLVSRAVDSFCSATRVEEKIEFDTPFSSLILDTRLLQSKIALFNNEGTDNVFSPSDYFNNVIQCWLEDNSSGDESFLFPRPIRAHNLDIWVAVLRAFQLMCRNLETKYAKKSLVLDYDAALTEAKNLCVSENERRGNLQEVTRNRYAALLCHRWEEYGEDPLYKGSFFNVVQDILNEKSYPTYDFPDSKDWQKLYRVRKPPSDDMVLKSIDQLKLMVTTKIPLLDSKILLIENSRMNLLNDLTRISVFDSRSYILRPLKQFLLDGVINTESKAKLAAIEAKPRLWTGR